jgi:hypothetical protein
MRPCLFSLRNPDDAHTRVVTIGLLDSNGAVILSGTRVRAGSGLISVLSWHLAPGTRAAYVRRQSAHRETKR